MILHRFVLERALELTIMQPPAPAHPASYPGQFALVPDPLHLAIPRMEIVAEMAMRGEHEALNDACLAVAVVAEAIATAFEESDSSS